MSCTTERARLAALKRHRNPHDPAITDAARELKTARLEDHIRRVVDSAPPLTAEQRNRLAILLRPALQQSGGGRL